MDLKRCSSRKKKPHTNPYWPYLKMSKTYSKGCFKALNTHTQTHTAPHKHTNSFLTLVWQLANIRGDSHVQHVIDSRVNIVSSLDVMFAVGLVALLVATVLQTVALQVFECWCATWGPTGRKGKCWLTVTSPFLIPRPSSLSLSWFVTSCLSPYSCPYLCFPMMVCTLTFPWI